MHRLHPDRPSIAVELTQPGGPSTHFAIAADHPTLLGALLAAGADLPSSCRNGSCRACLSQVQSGQISHVIDWPSLSAQERSDGYCLPCVARATSPRLVLRTGCLFES